MVVGKVMIVLYCQPTSHGRNFTYYLDSPTSAPAHYNNRLYGIINTDIFKIDKDAFNAGLPTSIFQNL